MQNVHTQETYTLFYNETTKTLEDHNNKLVLLENMPNRIHNVETQNTILQEKIKYQENVIHKLESQIYDVNKMMMKYLAYNKPPKVIIPETSKETFKF